MPPRSNPEILYRTSKGVVIAHSNRWTETEFSYRPIRESLAACGLQPWQAFHLFGHFWRHPVGSMQKIEDSHGTDIMEQVYPRIAWIEGKEIPVARVLFYPSFIRPGSRITHVFEDTAELILGRRRTGILEIIPTLIRRSENIVLDTDKTTHVSFEQGILGIFPKLAAGTRWLHFDIWPDYGPSFTMLYSAFPIPYSRAKRVPVFS